MTDLTRAIDKLEATLRTINPEAFEDESAASFCVCRHEILPPTKKMQAYGFTVPTCRNDKCPTKWWNRI